MFSFFKKKVTPEDMAFGFHAATFWLEPQDGTLLRILSEKVTGYDEGAVKKEIRHLRTYCVDLYIRDNELPKEPKRVLLDAYYSSFDHESDTVLPISRTELDGGLAEYRIIEQSPENIGRRIGEIFARRCGLAG